MKQKTQTLYIFGNWKMNPVDISSAESILKEILNIQKKFHTVKISLAVPSVFVSNLVKQSKGAIEIGVQNIHEEKVGAHTGDISVEQVKSVGVSFTILGHSERRSLGESDTLINKKVSCALGQNLKVLLCVGEDARDDSGEYLKIIKSQIVNALKGVDKKYIKLLTIAYEPVWAIGKNATGVATPIECLEVVILIRRTLSDLYGDTVSKKVVLLYGGSVNSENASGFFEEGGVQGFLPGRASLEPTELRKICEINK